MDAPFGGQRHGWGSACGADDSPGSGDAGPGVALRIALIEGYARNMLDLARHAHASWWGGCESIAANASSCTSQTLVRCSRALLSRNGFGWPTWDDFGAPLCLIAALPMADAMRVLRMRSLLVRHHAVRRCIDRERRMRLGGWVGERALEAIVSIDGGNRLTPVVTSGMPSLQDVTPESAAWEGWQLFEQDGLLTNADLFAPLRMRFPRDGPTSAWIGEIYGGDVTRTSVNVAECRTLLSLLPKLFPEWPW